MKTIKELDTRLPKKPRTMTRDEALSMIDKLDSLLPLEVQKLKSLIKRIQDHRFGRDW